MSASRIIKIISAVCFVLIVAILIILKNSPATGYEASIYTATPLIVWVGLIISFLCGLGIIFYQLYTKKHEENNLSLVGLLLIAVSFLTIISVHVVRGYILLGGDVTTHISRVQNLISSGHIVRENFYPVTHIYVAQFSHICSIDPMVLLLYVPTLFYPLHGIFVYLLARVLLPNKGQIILAIVAGMLLPSAFILMHATPFSLTYALMPLVFFLYLKRISHDTTLKPQFTVLLLIMVFLLPIFHPIAAIGFLLMLITIGLPNRLHSLIFKGRQFGGDEYSFIAPAAMLLFVWGITWLTSFYVWEHMIRNIHTIITEGGKSGLAGLKSDISYATGYGYSAIEHFFKQEAGLLLYGILAIISLPIMLKKLPSNENLRSLFSLYGPLGVYTFIMGMGLAPGGGFFLGRTTQYALLICAMFFGFASYEIIERARNASGKGFIQKLCLCLLVVALILVFINQVFKTYASSYMLAPNAQITSSEIRGMDWFIDNKKIDVSSLYLTAQCYRLKFLLLTPEEAAKRVDIPSWVPLPKPPYHFSYDNQTLFGESYHEDNYMVLCKRDRLLYTEVWPEIAKYRFYPQDFERLEHDPSVDKLYVNGGLDVWYIHSLAQASRR